MWALFKGLCSDKQYSLSCGQYCKYHVAFTAVMYQKRAFYTIKELLQFGLDLSRKQDRLYYFTFIQANK